ncbi:lovastatin nonaketide synthase [Verticillium alfalfae VaMs.102]|uniref:Lovastatin nonaketide synthase n=1 Tax=Verticillium alfalfae (strain VaMs.102 / ATCC MYA-4576 / FGSC 10136) TaxID=526221 RepID=C9SW47_VERA1|nr:lovastatin nonaketide synthase [Verticillium alfalfae VaMs.102]EEY23012.1 lovastatin nonaketide synthase [Verticillium alfalfae VaMs.102]
MGEPIRDKPLHGDQIPAAHLQPPIAVVGMGCRLPGNSNSPQALWQFISNGSVADNVPPTSRFRYATHYDGSGRAGTTPSPGAMFLGDEIDIAAFDAAFFNTSHHEAGSIDPQQRQLLEVMYECLENSGETLERIRGANVGCLVANNGCANSNSIAIDTACSGTLVAVDMACRYLQFQQADAMIVAGALLYLDPSAQQDRGPMHGALSTSGRCHTFDARADGYMRAEGVNAVYLKRLDDAIRDGDPIRAVIRGSATTGDGRTPSLTQPNPEAQANAIRAAYRNAGITDFSATGYVECHGTGTLAGDPLEITGLASAFASTRPVDQPLIIGSIKSNIGHSECAAGLSGLIKAVMAVERGVIPGNPTFITPNPNIDFEGSGVRASRTAMQWPSYAALPRRASVNSFGFGGSNAHVVLEAAETFMQDEGYRKTFKTLQDQHKPYTSNQNVSWKDRLRLLTFSANDRETLPSNVRVVSDYLRDPCVNAQADDVAYTLSDRRTHHFHRGFVVADSLDFDPSKIIIGKRKAQPPRIGFVFTGQGAQWPQMGKSLIENIPLARSVVDELDSALQTLPNAPQWTLLAELTEMRDKATLRCPEFSQPLVTALQLALLAVLQDWGIVGHKVLGHSSGEIAAAVAANLITPAEAIKTAYLRGQAAKRQSSDGNLGMMAAGVSASDIEKYLRSDVSVACFNSPTSLTLSGPVSTLESIREDFQNDGHFARLLQVDLAYHSPFMREIANDYHKMLQEHCPPSGKHLRGNSMLSSVTGHAMSSLGPSGALAGPLSQIIKSLPGGGKNIQYAAAASRGSETLAALFEVAGKVWARGGPIKLAKVNAYDRPSVLVDLPNYQWNHSRRYWREGLSTEEYRQRPFISHELLGSKVLSTSWQFPTWTKVIHLSDLPWLRDHRINGEVIFPTGAYVAMAVEAIRQSSIMARCSGGAQPTSFTYRMKNINVLERLVLDEAEGSRTRSILSPVHDSAEQWHTFTIQSYDEMAWVTNCIGYIRVDETVADGPSFPAETVPLRYSESGGRCYKRMAALGCDYGPHFQLIKRFQAAPNEKCSRGVLETESPEHHSSYSIHPVTIDGFLQLCGLSLQQSLTTAGESVSMVPNRIGSLTIPANELIESTCIGSVLPQYIGYGSESSRANLTVSGKLIHPKSGRPLLDMSGVFFDVFTPKEDCFTKHTYTRYKWDIDISLATAEGLNNMLLSQNPSPTSEDALQRLFDLISHQTPDASIIEVNMDDQSSSCKWLGTHPNRPHAKYTRFAGSEAVLAMMQGRYANCADTEFQILEALNRSDALRAKNDFAILTVGEWVAEDKAMPLLAKILSTLKEDGQLLVTDLDQATEARVKKALREAGCSCIKDLAPALSRGATLASSKQAEGFLNQTDITCLHLAAGETHTGRILAGLQSSGWNVRSITSTETIRQRTHVLILDELYTSVTATISYQQLLMIQELIKKECNILWVTTGAQMNITNPDRAATTGFLRTLRMEEVHLRIIALDVEYPGGNKTIPAIETCLRLLVNAEGKFRRESEFAEQQGLIHTPRLLVDDEFEVAKFDHLRGRQPEMLNVQGDTCLRLQMDVGSSTSLCREVKLPSILQQDHVEVEIFATELPPRLQCLQYTAWSGAAGTITALGSKVIGLEVGQRVAFSHDGYMLNRVYVGISNEDGRTLLQNEVPIPPNRIMVLNREDTSGDRIRLAGEVLFDVALGSFSDIHLAMVWRHVAEDGTLVLTEQTEDSTQVNLSLEPFTRGASFKVLNPQNIRKDTLICNQLLTETLGLLSVGSSLSSLSLKVFGYDQIENAVQWMKANKFAQAMLCRIWGQDVMIQIQPEPRTIKFEEHACYLLIGGLRGLCGSIAIDWARRGAKHLAVMSRSGYDDETSQRVLREIEGMGCHIDLLQGDITILDDVRRALSETSVPIRGILQGSMVLRDRPFPAMTIEEFHQAAGCKITGTWNIHNASQDLGLDLDFFTLLSSIASVLGGMAQANYAAGCSFLDAFAAYRHGLGLPTFSVNLGIIGEVGYMSRDEALLERHIGSVTTSINEDLMRQIIRYTVLQQSKKPISHSATSNIVTGIAVPQSGDSYLRLDKRFSHLFIGGDAQLRGAEDSETRDNARQTRELRALLATQPTTADRGVALELAIAVVSDYIAHAMHLSEPVEPERSLAMYGIDSLAAVAFRNWARMELGAGLSTGDVTMAPSLVALCESIVDGSKE